MRTLLAGLFALLAACSAGEKADQAIPPQFHASDNPALLSAWGQMRVDENMLALSSAVTPYELNTPLFSDYAHKLRTIWLPTGEQATYQEGQPFDFPVGTVITKTFYYPVPSDHRPGDKRVLKQTRPISLVDHKLPLAQIRLIETRILAKRAEGWVALPYVWNEEQSDARLQRTGDLQAMVLVDGEAPPQDFAYLVPNANQCAGCHATNNTTRKIEPIGPKPRHLNRPYEYATGAQNQLTHWQEAGFLKGAPAPQKAPRNARWTDETAPLDARARSYLDINCSHCHNEVGPADTSGLHLEPSTPVGPNLGLCKLPVAAGGGTGDRKYDIHPGAPEDSIFVYRMASTDPAAMMPELGRALAHTEGVQLVTEWITSLDGTCE